LDGALDGHRENVSKTKVFVCRKCKRHACVEDALDHSDGKVVLVRCQKICSGPVAGSPSMAEWSGLTGSTPQSVSPVCAYWPIRRGVNP
jgi:hypothetical protein